jgi:hypothetical protein
MRLPLPSSFDALQSQGGVAGPSRCLRRVSSSMRLGPSPLDHDTARPAR